MICIDVAEHGRAIAKEARCNFHSDNDHVISRCKDGTLLGGVIYQDYTGVSVAAHIAGFAPHWITPDLLWAMFHYPFVQLDCQKIVGFVPSYNERALAFDYKLGFKYVTKIPEVFPAGDLLVLMMEREECKWLSIRPRQLSEG